MILPYNFIKSNKVRYFLILICSIFFIIIFPTIYINTNYFLQSFKSNSVQSNSIGLVLGAQVRKNKPSDVLRLRLDKSAELYFDKKITKILVSGSNQSEFYNEPKVMKNYLVSVKGVSENDIIEDFAGLRTLDSCYRAKKVFNAKNIVIITQNFHLPRAYFLCQQAGFEFISTSSANDSTIGVTTSGYSREVLANWNAFIDILLNEDAKYSGDGSETIIE
jgi:vancomycin permeability regulator SanA